MNHFILFGVLLLQFCHMTHSLSCFQCNLTECKQPVCKGNIFMYDILSKYLLRS